MRDHLQKQHPPASPQRKYDIYLTLLMGMMEITLFEVNTKVVKYCALRDCEPPEAIT